MKKIPLTQGQFALVDDEDYDFLTQWKWHAVKCKNTFYASRSVTISTKKQKSWRMHMEVSKTFMNGRLIDHKDGNGLNNQKENLRVANKHGNACNSKVKCTCKSGFKGVRKELSRKTWSARIFLNNKDTRIGSFSTPEEAARAYDAAAKKHFGEFARLNFPDE